jgi:tyrosine-protein kinase Etk/Wzc
MTNHLRSQSHFSSDYFPEPAKSDLDFHVLLALVLDAKWLIASIAAAVLLLTVLYAIFATPVYRADVLLQVNENNAVFQPGPTGELAAKLENQAPPAAAEIAIMRSRYVIGQAVDKLGLTITAEPDYLPLIGPSIARHYNGERPAPPFLWFSSHAWGGEQLKVTRLNIPRDWLNHPLTLIAGADGGYTFFGPDGEKLLIARVGRLAYLNASASGRGQGEGNRNQAALPHNPPSQSSSTKRKRARATGDGNQISLFVSKLSARPGTHFTITKRPRLTVIKSLQKKLSISETDKGTNIVNVSLAGSDPQQVVATLNAIAAAYVHQNAQNNTEQAHESLKFLKTQLPKLKAKLNAAQTALSQYQTRHQALDVSADTKALLDRMSNIQKQLSQLTLKQTEMSGRFNAAYPGLHAMRAQIASIQQIKAQLDARIDDIPKAQQQIVRLRRNVDVDNSLYMALLTQAQQLRVTQAGAVGNARIIDRAAVPMRPVKPRKALVIMIGLMLGLILGVLIAFIKKALVGDIRDPDSLEPEFGVPLYAVIPFSKTQAAIARETRGNQLPLLARAQNNDLAMEAIRGLRATLHIIMQGTERTVLTIGGASPGPGKSFVLANLAHLIAQSGRRVLLVDSDLHKGHLNDYFGYGHTPGLSEILSGQAELDEVVRADSTPGLNFVATGSLPSDPSELLLTSRFEKFIAEASDKYDVVLLDVPPYLAVSDGFIIARYAKVNFLLVRDGGNTRREIAHVIHRLQQCNVQLTGFIYNGFDGHGFDYAHRGYGAPYRYRYE